MRNYELYFEFFGRNMRTTILAESEEDAKQKLISRLSIHKVVKKPHDLFNVTMDGLDEIERALDQKKKQS